MVRSLAAAIGAVKHPALDVETWIPDTPVFRQWAESALGLTFVYKAIERRGKWARLRETVLRPPRFAEHDKVLVLGDLPLAGVGHQTVFIHLAHLVAPQVDGYVSRSLSYRIQRWVLARNLKYTSKVIVQTSAMGDSLRRSYPRFEGAINVISSPSPIAGVRAVESLGRGRLFRFLFPAGALPHKNHAVLWATARCCLADSVPAEFLVTLDEAEAAKFDPRPANVVICGKLTAEKMVEAYAAADGLFFPSVLESYGLPLVEAMGAGLAIVAADRPYARCLCGDRAHYFSPYDSGAATKAIRDAIEAHHAGEKPQWGDRLGLIEPDWPSAARKFLAVVFEANGR